MMIDDETNPCINKLKLQRKRKTRHKIWYFDWGSFYKDWQPRVSTTAPNLPFLRIRHTLETSIYTTSHGKGDMPLPPPLLLPLYLENLFVFFVFILGHGSYLNYLTTPPNKTISSLIFTYFLHTPQAFLLPHNTRSNPGYLSICLPHPSLPLMREESDHQQSKQGTFNFPKNFLYLPPPPPSPPSHMYLSW